MPFKNAAQRGAFFEKQKQKNGTVPELSPMSKLSKLPKTPSLPTIKPLGSFEKLKRSIKMPKAGY